MLVVALTALLLAGEPLAEVATAYGIEVVTDPGFPVKIPAGVIAGRRAEREALDEYAPLFAAEFSLYPAALVRRARLERVVLCRDLSFAGQARTAIPDWTNRTLYLDVSRGARNKVYVRKVLHHEFFHLIDYWDDGLVYQDERWAALNPAGFKYGRGGRTVQDNPKTSVLTGEYPGFLNHYSTTGVEEDKAEVFAHLLVDPAHVEERGRTDRVLAAKVVRMKELLAAFCPEADDAFWEKARRRAEPERVAAVIWVVVQPPYSPPACVCQRPPRLRAFRCR